MHKKISQQRPIFKDRIFNFYKQKTYELYKTITFYKYCKYKKHNIFNLKKIQDYSSSKMFLSNDRFSF